jgi:hypothetical protein
MAWPTAQALSQTAWGVWRAVVFVDLVILDFKQRNLGKLMIPKRLLSDTGSIGRCGDNGYFSLMLDKSR